MDYSLIASHALAFLAGIAVGGKLFVVAFRLVSRDIEQSAGSRNGQPPIA